MRDRPVISRRPGQRPAYADHLFGPFTDPDTSESNRRQNAKAGIAQVVHYSDGPIDIRGATEFRLVARQDLEKFTWGRLTIPIQSSIGAAIVTIDTIPHVEIRIITYISGTAEIVFEGAGGQRQESGSENSPGPISFEWDANDTIPDTYEVYARARRGGVAETATPGADETLQVSVYGRFHR